MLMFKILIKTFQTHTFKRNDVTRQFAHYCDTGEHHFLDKLNYIGSRGIYWTHPQSSFITRITDDYDHCLQGNQSSDDNTCWWYFPKKMRTAMEKDFTGQDVRDIEGQIRNWKLIQNAPTKNVHWFAAVAARCYAWFSHVSTEQKIFAAKQFASTIHTDDAIENLISSQQFDSAADELLKNLEHVSQKSDKVTDMRKFKGRNNIPDRYIDKAIDTIEIQKELMQLAKQILKPKIYDLFALGCHDYLSGVTAEKVLFQQHCPSKTIISELDGKLARHCSIGFKWILPTMMTDEVTSIHLSHQNPAVDLATSIATFENDTVGYFRDNFVEFSPMTHLDTNSSAQSDLDAARVLADRANEMKKGLVYVWENVPTENAKHYEYLAKYVGCVTDYSFLIGLRRANNRYGWIPQLD